MTETDMIVDLDIKPQHKQTKIYLTTLSFVISTKFFLFHFTCTDFLSMSGFILRTYVIATNIAPTK